MYCGATHSRTSMGESEAHIAGEAETMRMSHDGVSSANCVSIPKVVPNTKPPQNMARTVERIV
jgi:hypothetical protein